MRNLSINVNSGPEFSKCRTVLKSQQKQLKALGYGNQPNASDKITDSDIEKLFDHG